MVTFTNFMDQLPDPNYDINDAGALDNTTGNPGPGFAKIKFSSNNQIQVTRTISGRGVTASPGYHMWEFSINYNPMTRAEFEPVASFLESRRGRLYPFYVVLPQHAAPRDATFAAYAKARTVTITNAVLSTVTTTNDTITFTFDNQYDVNNTLIATPFGSVGNRVVVEGLYPIEHNGIYLTTASTQNTIVCASKSTNAITGFSEGGKISGIVASSAASAGASTILIRGPGLTGTVNPSPGDFITITDPNDSNHKKAYKIVRVENSNLYQTGTTAPLSYQKRLHIIPPLTRAVTQYSAINFINPRFRVIQKSDTIEYDLDTDNLYQFSLNLEEILP